LNGYSNTRDTVSQRVTAGGILAYIGVLLASVAALPSLRKSSNLEHIENATAVVGPVSEETRGRPAFQAVANSVTSRRSTSPLRKSKSNSEGQKNRSVSPKSRAETVESRADALVEPENHTVNPTPQVQGDSVPANEPVKVQADIVPTKETPQPVYLATPQEQAKVLHAGLENAVKAINTPNIFKSIHDYSFGYAFGHYSQWKIHITALVTAYEKTSSSQIHYGIQFMSKCKNAADGIHAKLYGDIALEIFTKIINNNVRAPNVDGLMEIAGGINVHEKQELVIEKLYRGLLVQLSAINPEFSLEPVKILVNYVHERVDKFGAEPLDTAYHALGLVVIDAANSLKKLQTH